MPITRPAYSPEFRRQIIDLVRAGRAPVDLAREFEPSAASIRKWVALADKQEGRRRAGVTTTKRDKEARPAPDLVDRNVTATAPNQVWVADIAFVSTPTGFLDLAVVLDAWSRKPDAERQSEVVGWSMAHHLRAASQLR